MWDYAGNDVRLRIYRRENKMGYKIDNYLNTLKFFKEDGNQDC